MYGAHSAPLATSPRWSVFLKLLEIQIIHVWIHGNSWYSRLIPECRLVQLLIMWTCQGLPTQIYYRRHIRIELRGAKHFIRL